MKKFFSLIMFAICATFLFGCATIEYQRIVNPDGSIIDSVIFEIDKNINLTTSNQMLDDIYTDIQKYYVIPVEQVRDSYSVEHMDASVASGITIVLERNRDYRTVKITTQCDSYEHFECLCTEILPNVYTETSSIVDGGEEDPIGRNVGLFIVKYIEKTTNAFGNIEDFALKLQDNTLPQVNFCERYSKRYGGGEYHSDNTGTYNASDIKLRQMYVSSDTRLGSNATYTLVEGGFKYHLWELDSSNPDFKLEFYHNYPNAVGWYYLALGITFVLVFALLLMYSKRVHSKDKALQPTNEVQPKDFDEEIDEDL